MKKILCVFILFVFIFTNTAIAPLWAITYYAPQFRNEIVYPAITTQTITETITTEKTFAKVIEHPNTPDIIIHEEKQSNAGKIGAAILGTLLIGGIITLAVLDDNNHHHRHHKPPKHPPHPRH